MADSSRLEILVVVRYLEAAVDYLQRDHGIGLPRSKLLAHHLLRLHTLEFSHVETLAVDLHVAAFVQHCRSSFAGAAAGKPLVDRVFANAIGHANHTRVELADSAAQDRRSAEEAVHEI
jgi:hypothetical protein